MAIKLLWVHAVIGLRVRTCWCWSTVRAAECTGCAEQRIDRTQRRGRSGSAASRDSKADTRHHTDQRTSKARSTQDKTAQARTQLQRKDSKLAPANGPPASG